MARPRQRTLPANRIVTKINKGGLRNQSFRASAELSGQTGQSNDIDPREKIFQKLQKIKDMYFLDLRELLQRMTIKCQQPMAADQLEKLKLYRTKVHRMMQYCQVPKISIPPGFPEDKIDAVEKKIRSVLWSFKPGKTALRREPALRHEQMYLRASAASVQPSTVQHSFMPQLQ